MVEADDRVVVRDRSPDEVFAGPRCQRAECADRRVERTVYEQQDPRRAAFGESDARQRLHPGPRLRVSGGDVDQTLADPLFEHLDSCAGDDGGTEPQDEGTDSVDEPTACGCAGRWLQPEFERGRCGAVAECALSA